jgi:ribosomal-protein-alanine N-acetyltransferase
MERGDIRVRTPKTAVQSEITLRPLLESDVTEKYLSWFKDERVTKYIEAKNLTKEECLNYIRNQDGYFLYAIMLEDTHIGNLKIGPINRKHGLSDLITILDPDYWGKGYAVEAIRKGVDLSFNQYGVRKIAAGIWSGNMRSIMAYTKAGFQIEAVLREHYMVDGNPQDRICISIFNPNCNKE